MTDLVTPVLRSMLPGPLVRELEGEVTDHFLELLLQGMKLAFMLSGDYRENLRGFRGVYAFQTADGTVSVSARFADGKMHVDGEAAPDWDVKVTFENPQALWSFLLSKDQDILNSILRDEVEVEGNLNYVYKLGYMARELVQRLGVA
jgi:ubiquinone biosynthesis protein UbiJ